MKRTCKMCKVKFEPQYNAVQPYCDFECALNHSKILKEKKKKKAWSKEKKERKDALKTNSDYVKELQVVFNKFIRLRDKDKGCISCNKPLTSKFDAGHFFSTGSYPELRFHEMNVHGQCVHCNQHKRGNLIEYADGLEQRYSYGVLATLKALKNTPKKYTILELKELKEYYKKKIAELK